MRVERRKRRSKDGAVVLSERYTARWRDRMRKQCSFPLFVDKRSSEAFARKLQRLIDVREGGEPLDGEMMRWVAGRTEDQMRRLIKLGLVDPRRIAVTKPIAEHVAAWRDSIDAVGRTATHVKTTVSRVERAFEELGVREWGDIEASDISAWLKERSSEALAAEERISVRTVNTYIQSLRQFTRWMVTQERAQVDPLLKLEYRSTGSGDRVRERRALSIEECRALVHAAQESAADVAGVDGETRALLWRIMLATGLRLGEALALEVSWIEFGEISRDQETVAQVWSGRPTTIRPPARATKAGRKTGRIDVIVVAMELHEHLRRACRGRMPKARLLERVGPRSGKREAIPVGLGSRMIKFDLALAGLPYVDGAGRYADCHSLRHSALTLMADAAPSRAVMGKLARHSDPKVTDGYMHAEVRALADVVERLPRIDGDEPDAGDSESPRLAVGAETVDTQVDHSPSSQSLTVVVDDGAMGGSCGVNAVGQEICNPSPYHLAMPPSEAGSIPTGGEGGGPPTPEVAVPGDSAPSLAGAGGEQNGPHSSFTGWHGLGSSGGPSAGPSEVDLGETGVWQARPNAYLTAFGTPIAACARVLERNGHGRLAELVRRWPQLTEEQRAALIAQVGGGDS